MVSFFYCTTIFLAKFFFISKFICVYHINAVPVKGLPVKGLSPDSSDIYMNDKSHPDWDDF